MLNQPHDSSCGEWVNIFMKEQIEQLHTVADWEACQDGIPEQGLLMFKFSPRCPISKSIERKFDAWYEQLDEKSEPRCVKVDVVNDRELSRHIAEELHIGHESPQVIWLTSDRQMHWHASHWSISRRALNEQLATVSAG